jgi:hypothetical protein
MTRREMVGWASWPRQRMRHGRRCDQGWNVRSLNDGWRGFMAAAAAWGYTSKPTV